MVKEKKNKNNNSHAPQVGKTRAKICCYKGGNEKLAKPSAEMLDADARMISRQMAKSSGAQVWLNEYVQINPYQFVVELFMMWIDGIALAFQILLKLKQETLPTNTLGISGQNSFISRRHRAKASAALRTEMNRYVINFTPPEIYAASLA